MCKCGIFISAARYVRITLPFMAAQIKAALPCCPTMLTLAPFWMRSSAILSYPKKKNVQLVFHGISFAWRWCSFQASTCTNSNDQCCIIQCVEYIYISSVFDKQPRSTLMPCGPSNQRIFKFGLLDIILWTLNTFNWNHYHGQLQ